MSDGERKYLTILHERARLIRALEEGNKIFEESSEEDRRGMVKLDALLPEGPLNRHQRRVLQKKGRLTR